MGEGGGTPEQILPENKPGLWGRVVRSAQLAFGAEHTFQELSGKNQRDANRLVRELAKKRGDRCLLLTLGWDGGQFAGEDAATRRLLGMYNYVDFSTFSAEQFLGLYEEVRKLAPNEKIAVAVSRFNPRKNSPPLSLKDVVGQMVKISKENGWSVPKVISVARGDQADSDILRREFPDIYLGDYPQEDDPVGKEVIWEAIERDKLPSMGQGLEAARTAATRTLGSRVEEMLVEPRMEEKAKELVRELEACSGKRGLMLIIDDSTNKIDHTRKVLEEHAQQSGVSYVISYEKDGSQGIALLSAFRRIAPGEKVVILMDGLLPGQMLEKGDQVVERLKDVCRQRGLAMPFIIGNSSDDKWNEEIREAAPEVYLGDWYSDEKETLREVDSKL